jgi:hypothetical protein
MNYTNVICLLKRIFGSEVEIRTRRKLHNWNHLLSPPIIIIILLLACYRLLAVGEKENKGADYYYYYGD